MALLLLRGGFRVADGEIDTTSLTQRAVMAVPEHLRTVRAMLTQPEQIIPDPSDVFLDTEGHPGIPGTAPRGSRPAGRSTAQ
ncbi:MAG: hypothetical protein ACXIVQ_02680 [Acidimicrobiales bacterium]